MGLTAAHQIILPLTALFCTAILLAGALRLLAIWASIRLSFAFGSDLSNDVYRRTLYQPYAVHISRNSSEVINGIWVKVSEVIFYILMPFLTLISSVIMVLSITAIILTIIPTIALLAFGGIGVIYALVIAFTKSKLKRNSEHIAHESTNLVKNLQEGLSGIRDVLIDGSQASFCDTYRNTDQVLRRAQANNQIINQSPRFVVEAMGMVVIALLAYVLSLQPGGVVAAVPTLAALALALQRLLPVSQQLYGAWSTINGAQASLVDVLKLLDQPLPMNVEQLETSVLPFKDHIRIRNLAFRYNATSPWVLDGIDFTIRKGSRVGFVGMTGSGKSTLLDIIMGLLQPTVGSIEIDGQSVTPLNCRAWQAHIAHVPQSVFLSDSSIEENIAFGVPRHLIDSDRVRFAAGQAQIADIVEKLPSGYRTFVGERGVQLSGGQRQRIGIARALYKRADVIIFDEATSALDGDTEQYVMEAIEALSADITILIIAHRLNTLRNCTEIIEVSKGGVACVKGVLSS